jgi:glycosyltransferase involved in cell wall biosynthesis
MPANAVLRDPVALWDWEPRRNVRGRPRTVRLLDEVYRALLTSMLDPGAIQRGFDLALREWSDLMHTAHTSIAFESDLAVAALLDIWPVMYPQVPISVLDAVQASELMQHLLVPAGASRRGVDVCHPVSNGLPALVALATKWRHGTPFIMSEHGVYLRERYLGIQDLHYSWPVKTIMLSFMRRLCQTAYREADLVAPVNVFNRRWETRHGADPDRIRTVYNGVDAHALPVAAAEPPVPTVGWVGRIDPLKDLETLVQAFAVVRDQVPGAVLRLFGPTPAGNEGYEARIRALITQLGLDSQVSFEGPIRPVTTAYHASTVVALSSISEGLPYTVMEAMMCARATVSTDVGGVREVTGPAGIVVPPRDPAVFGAALTDLLLNEGRRRQMAAEARERSLSMFQLQTMIHSFRSVYQELADGKIPGADTQAQPVWTGAAVMDRVIGYQPWGGPITQAIQFGKDQRVRQ